MTKLRKLLKKQAKIKGRIAVAGLSKEAYTASFQVDIFDSDTGGSRTLDTVGPWLLTFDPKNKRKFGSELAVAFAASQVGDRVTFTVVNRGLSKDSFDDTGSYDRAIQWTVGTEVGITTEHINDNFLKLLIDGDIPWENPQTFYGDQFFAGRNRFVYTPAYLTSGNAPTTVVATWEAVTDGAFQVTIDGVARSITGIDFSDVGSLDQVCGKIQTAIRALTSGKETVEYTGGRFIIKSGNTSSTSAITVLTAGASGTDISGVGATAFLDSETGRGTVTAKNMGMHVTPSVADLTELAALTGVLEGAEMRVASTGLKYDYMGGSWIERSTGGTIPNASTTVAGKSEEAIPSELGSSTEIGGTGAPLFVSPKSGKKTSSGAADENYFAVLNAAGQFADGFISKTSVNQHLRYAVTLGETVVAGNGLRLAMHDGKAYKWTDTKGYRSYTQTGQTNIGLQTTPGALLANNGRLFTYRVTTNKFLFLYETASLTWRLACGTVASGKWTMGAAVTLGTDAQCQINGKNPVAVLDATTIGVVLKHQTDNKIYAHIGTIATNTITLGAAVAESITTTYTYPCITGTGTAGTKTFAVAANNSTTDVKVWGITISGTTPTWGTAVAVESTVIDTPPDIVNNGENKFIVSYQKSTTVVKEAHISQTDNTTTVAVDGSPVTIHTAGGATTSLYTAMFRIADNKHILLVMQTGYPAANDLLLYSYIVTVSGTTPSSTGSVLVKTYTKLALTEALGNINYLLYGLFDLKVLSSSYAVMFMVDSQRPDTEFNTSNAARTYGRAVWVDVSGTTPVFKHEPTDFSINSASALQYSACITWEDGSEFTPYFHFLDVGGFLCGTANKIATVKIEPNNVIGWAQSGGNANDSIQCDPLEDTNQSGLVAGVVYRTGASGALQNGLTTNGGTGKPVAIPLPGSTTAVRRLLTA